MCFGLLRLAPRADCRWACSWNEAQRMWDGEGCGERVENVAATSGRMAMVVGQWSFERSRDGFEQPDLSPTLCP